MPILVTLVAVATPLKMKKTKEGRNQPLKEAGGVRPKAIRHLFASGGLPVLRRFAKTATNKPSF